MTDQSIQQDAICYLQQDAICYLWFTQRLVLSISKLSITSQWSQIKEDTVEPSVLAGDINL